MKTLKFFIAGFFLLGFSACENRLQPDFSEDYKQTPSGLYYKIYTQSNREKVIMGDILFCVFKMYWCDERVETNLPDSTILSTLELSRFSGDIIEGLLMMKVGDSASFLIPADSVIKHWSLDKSYEHHLCDYLKIIVRIDSLLPFDPIAHQEQITADSIAETKHQFQISDEIRQLRNHVRKKNISAEPNSDGVYVVILRKGNGAAISKGKIAVFDFTFRSLTGTVLDSSDEDISYEAGIAFPQRHYKPQEIKIGENQWMIALDNALIGQTVGSKLRLFMPSGAVFGNSGNRFVDEFTSVVLDVDLLEIK
jgi:FKBP-type peptidyl-prolyl cis-trans isomerase